MPKSRQNPVEDLFEQAREHSRADNPRKTLSSLLKLFNLDPSHREGLQCASKAMFLLKDVEGAKVLARLAENPEDPERLYQAGYHFVSMRRPDGARGFLEKCLRLTGENSDVLYELGYCNYLDRKYARAAEMLRKASRDLSLERALVADLLTIECLLFAYRDQEALELLRSMEEEFRAWGRSDTVDALEIMLARYRAVDLPKPWDLRTWHFVRHGGVLLAQSDRPGSHGQFDNLSFNALAVGGMLRLLKALFEGLSIDVEAILYLGDACFPLALAAAGLFERPARAWQNRSCYNELLVLSDPEVMIEEKVFPIARDQCAYLFCFQAFPFKEHLIVPDVLGLMVNRFRFPWQEQIALLDHKDKPVEVRTFPEDPRNPEEIAAEITQSAKELPEDSKSAPLVDFFARHRDLVTLCSADRFPQRLVFNPVTPA